MSNVDLLNMNPNRAFKISGAAVGDLTGNSVSSAGDVNGDGFNDIVVGAPLAGPNGRSYAGVAYVIYGKSGGMTGIDTASTDLASFTTAQGFAILGATSQDYTGWSVSNAGDINGDGFNDIVVGAPSASPNDKNRAGVAYVIYGKNTGFTNIDLASFTVEQGFKILGAAGGDNTGSSVSSVGDINGDGFNDIVVGAYLASPNVRDRAGAAYVVYGKDTGFTDIDLASFTVAQGFEILGATAGDNTGISVSSAGDINGDGFNDIVVGAYGASPNGRSNAGVAYVIYGKDTGFTNIDLASFAVAQGFAILGAATGDRTGSSVSSAGDINGDGFNDIVVGAYGASPNGRNNAGVAYVIYGKNTGFSNIDLASFTSAQGFTILGAVGGEPTGDYTGISVSSAGDINGDGINDIIVGALYASLNGRSQAGTAYVIYGKNTGFTNIDLASFTVEQGFTIMGAVANDRTGISVSSAEDINGDGFNDIVIGAIYASPNGRSQAGAAYVIYGKKLIIGSGGNISPSIQPEDIECLAGINVINYTASNIGVTVNLATNIGIGGYAAGDIIYNCENIIGSGYADTLIGDANANNIQGGAGDDLIEGKAGSDMLDGGAGTDSLSYTSSPAAVTVNLPNNTVSGGDATGDIISNFENIIGSGYADTLIGDANANNIQGGAGDDLIEGKAGSDVLDGGAGTDSLSYISSPAAVTVNLTNNTVSGGDATGDIISNFENIIGSSYSDTLAGDANVNNIQGEAGDDIIEGMAGADTLDGGAGTNSLSYNSSISAVTVNLTNNTVSGGDATGDMISNFENIIGYGYADVLTGDADINNIQGGAGDDIVEGKAGADTLDGGAGTDNLIYRSSISGVAVSLASGTGTAGDAAGDVISNFENIIGSDHDDMLIGDANGNNIQGGAGNDIIEGMAGPDMLDGGTGTNSLSYNSSISAVIVSLATNTATGGDATGDIFSGFENIIGSGYADILIGDANVNNIQGGIGDDVIEGKEEGDILDGGIGIDTLSYMSSTVAVTIDLSTDTATGGDATGDIISNFENIIGSGYADILTGDVNSNSIMGEAGDDVLKDGDGGEDVFSGDSGADTFVISSLDGIVTITDFNDAERDKIDLGDFNIGFTEIMNSAQNDGNDCHIVLGNKEIILQNINKNDIQESWFLSLAVESNTPAEPAKWPTTEDLLKLIPSLVGGIITIGGFAAKSYQYYKPGALGHNKFYSFASSIIPKFVMKTTANIIREAEATIKTVIDLQAQYTSINSQLINHELQKALVQAEHSCKAAAAEATIIRDAAQKVLLTATGKTAEAARVTYKIAEAARDLYSDYSTKYSTDLKELTEITPIGIALSDNKIALVSFNASSVSFDYHDNGIKAKTAWVGSQDAFLVYDHNDNKQVDAAKELVLTKWSKTATGDFEALKEVFDSNKDNKFDANDAEFAKFRIWQDKNQDGISQSGELTSLFEAGLLQINFDTEKSIHGEFFDREQDMNIVEVLWVNGDKTLAYDLALQTTGVPTAEML